MPEKPSNKPGTAPEMDAAVRNMFSLSPEQSKKITEAKPGRRRGESALDELGKKFMEYHTGSARVRGQRKK